MPKFTEEEYEQLKKQVESNRRSLDPDRPISKRKRGERGPSLQGIMPKATPPLDDGPGTLNVCPDCGAMYDASKRCEGDKNRRQFTRWDRATGTDIDYFVCFCGKDGYTYERYK